MQEQSMNQEKFGLGEIPPDATNELLLDPSFTKKDFLRDLKKACKKTNKPKSALKLSKT